MPWHKSLHPIALTTPLCPLFLVIKVNYAKVTKNFSAGTNNEVLRYVIRALCDKAIFACVIKTITLFKIGLFLETNASS